MPPVQIRFVPDQRRLTSVVRQLSASNRSYPLMELAYLFFSKPEYCLVKIESGANDNPELRTLRASADALEVSVRDLIEP